MIVAKCMYVSGDKDTYLFAAVDESNVPSGSSRENVLVEVMGDVIRVASVLQVNRRMQLRMCLNSLHLEEGKLSICNKSEYTVINYVSIMADGARPAYSMYVISDAWSKLWYWKCPQRGGHCVSVSMC